MDYLGLGGRYYIGDQKQPKLSIYTLDQSAQDYQKQLFRGNDRIRSSIFLDLAITAEQIFRSGMTAAS